MFIYMFIYMCFYTYMKHRNVYDAVGIEFLKV